MIFFLKIKIKNYTIILHNLELVWLSTFGQKKKKKKKK